jgi:hypothetical protein
LGSRILAGRARERSLFRAVELIEDGSDLGRRVAHHSFEPRPPFIGRLVAGGLQFGQNLLEGPQSLLDVCASGLQFSASRPA